ncbi:MAG: hypothetical protein NVS4B7_02000 [Ktedonobacteraceae bacterium]
MPLDVELYRRTLYLPLARSARQVRRISVIDICPENATHTLVLVHGYGGSALQWLYQLRFFGQTMHVIAPDMRGHGLSDDPDSLPYTMVGLVDELETVLNTLTVRRPFALIAHSFGGAIATEYALLHPEDVSNLVLIGVPTRFIVRPILRRLMNVPDPIFSRVAKLIGVALYAPQRTLKRMHNKVMYIWRGAERLQQLRVPTLVVLGQRDTVFLRQHYEDVPRAIPNAHQTIIPVSAHLVQLERPDAVNRAIRRFIEAKQQSAKAEKQQHIARSAALAARSIDMPWLQHYDSDVPDTISPSQQLLHDMLSNAACEFPGRPAIIFFGQKISYAELDLVSNRFAHALRELGLQSRNRVAILLPNVPQCVIAFYGTLKAGGVVVLGSPLSSEEEIAYQLQNSDAQVLLTLTSYRSFIERVCVNSNVKYVIYTDVREYLPIGQRILIASLIEGIEPHSTSATLSPENLVQPPSDTNLTEEHHSATLTASISGKLALRPQAAFREYSLQPLLRSQPTSAMNSGTTSQDLALIQYTSGTTDVPKGVMLSHSNLMVNVIQKRHWMPDAHRGREVILCVLPLSHSYGVTSCMNISMAIAASMVLLPTRRTDQVLEAIKEHHPTIFPGVPALYLAIANYPKVRSFGVSSIRVCISGSAPLPVAVQEAFEKLTKGHLVEGYGLTEASPVTHSNPLKGERRVGSIGIPLPSTSARIVDLKTGETLPVGEVGELLIRGPQVMLGYWQMPDETAQVLRDDWLHTGDLAQMDEDGFFTIVDRKKDLILSGAYNVYPRDVEEVLYEHPKVLEAAVVSTYSFQQANGTNGENTTAVSPFIKAVVVLKRGEKATADELLALCRERLDAYKVPSQIEFRTELPKNIVGKVLRRLLIEA